MYEQDISYIYAHSRTSYAYGAKTTTVAAQVRSGVDRAECAGRARAWLLRLQPQRQGRRLGVDVYFVWGFTSGIYGAVSE
jgi:hypothetical protein